ncbi:hypothetical protein ACQ4PT_054949 [Festuca glaucescens]
MELEEDGPEAAGAASRHRCWNLLSAGAGGPLSPPLELEEDDPKAAGVEAGGGVGGLVQVRDLAILAVKDLQVAVINGEPLQNRSTMVISFSCSASTKLACILALLLILVTTIQVHGQSTSGFLSIDCGLTNSSDYVDNTLKLMYNSDSDFVRDDLNHEILPEFMAGVGNDQQKTLRNFPDGLGNCYTLPSTIGKKYLLRATFTYCNYDRLNKTLDGSLFLFGLHIGVNFWEAVNFTNWDPTLTTWKELVTVAPSNNLSVCLINFGSGTPFISSLELRPLEDTMYPFFNTSVSVSCFQRYRFGNVNDFITR